MVVIVVATCLLIGACLLSVRVWRASAAYMADLDVKSGRFMSEREFRRRFVSYGSPIPPTPGVVCVTGPCTLDGVGFPRAHRQTRSVVVASDDVVGCARDALCGRVGEIGPDHVYIAMWRRVGSPEPLVAYVASRMGDCAVFDGRARARKDVA